MFDLVRRRMRSQRLLGAPFASAADVVAWFGAVQAQDYAGAKWALAARTRSASDLDVERLHNDGAILRTHVLRPTWHFVAPRDLRWLLALTAPRVKRAMAYHDRQLDIDARVIARASTAFTNALSGGKHLTRSELSRALSRAKIAATGHRLGNLVMHAELDAVICSGARRGKQVTYALVSERCPATPPLSRDEALGQLASRYFTSHGPALARDFAWWSGLTLSDARRGIELARPRPASRTLETGTYWFAEATTAARSTRSLVHLLPSYDEYLVAYQDRETVLASGIGKQSIAQLLNPVVVLDGRVIGGWRRALQSSSVAITTSLVTALSRQEQRALGLAVERFGKFLKLPARLVR